MAKKRLSSNQIYAINVIRKQKSIPESGRAYFHPATVKFLLNIGIVKKDRKDNLTLNPRWKAEIIKPKGGKMTQYQKQVVRQLLRQAGYKEQKKWWENNDIKSVIMKADLFADDPPSIDIVDELRKANPYRGNDRNAYEIAKDVAWGNCCQCLSELLNQKEEK